jgi:hypothetical protein
VVTQSAVELLVYVLNLHLFVSKVVFFWNVSITLEKRHLWSPVYNILCNISKSTLRGSLSPLHGTCSECGWRKQPQIMKCSCKYNKKGPRKTTMSSLPASELGGGVNNPSPKKLPQYEMLPWGLDLVEYGWIIKTQTEDGQSMTLFQLYITKHWIKINK